MCEIPRYYTEGARVRVIKHGTDPKYARVGTVVQSFGGPTSVFDVIFDGDTWRTTCCSWDTVETIREKEVGFAPGEEKENPAEAVVDDGPAEAEVDLRGLLQEAWRLAIKRKDR